MTEAGLLYSNARIKSMEKSLVSPLQMQRLLDCETFSDAVKVLAEFGYSGGPAADDERAVENLLAAERAAATDFFKENIFKKSGLETLLLPCDYHNLKAFLKVKYGQVKDAAPMLYPNGTILVEDLKCAVFEGGEWLLKIPKEMAELIAYFENAAEQCDVSGRLIDSVTDRATYKAVFATLKKCRSAVLLRYFKLKVDFLNLKNFFRVRKYGLDKTYFEQCFLDGGDLDKQFLWDYFDESLDVFVKKTGLLYPQFEVAAKLLDGGKTAEFETYADNQALKIFRDDRNEMFTVAPIAGFYLAKMTELKSVKLIVAAVKNGVGKQQLKARLRDLYA